MSDFSQCVIVIVIVISMSKWSLRRGCSHFLDAGFSVLSRVPAMNGQVSGTEARRPRL